MLEGLSTKDGWLGVSFPQMAPVLNRVFSRFLSTGLKHVAEARTQFSVVYCIWGETIQKPN